MNPGELLPLVYDELRRLAAAKIVAEKPGYTLDATAFVQEAWLKLAAASVEWRDRTHFLRMAATADRMWRFARAWLRVEMRPEGPFSGDTTRGANP